MDECIEVGERTGIMKLFKKRKKRNTINKFPSYNEGVIGVGYRRNFSCPNFGYTPEKLEELIASLENTILFLKSNIEIETAFQRKNNEEVERLLGTMPNCNMNYLYFDENKKCWQLGLSEK